MSTEEQEIEAVRARVAAWAEYDVKRRAYFAGPPYPRGAECVAMNGALDAAEALGERPDAGVIALVAKLDRLEALERAILSAAGDETQRECVRISLEGIAYCAKTGRLGGVATFGSAYLAQSKALADLRSAVLALKDALETVAHTEDCGHYACTDPDECQDGTEGDRSLCNDVGIPCSCGVVGAIDLIKLARGEAGEKEGG